jgi:hypothetical protein
MSLQLTKEFIPDQFGESCRRLIQLADDKVTAQCTAKVVEETLCRGDEVISAQNEPLAWLAHFYIRTVRPFLGAGPAAEPLLSSPEQARLMFDQVRATLPDNCHDTVSWLARVCDDRRQLAEQQKLHGLLHSWLKVHIPVSVALGVFTVVHVIMSLYY